MLKRKIETQEHVIEKKLCTTNEYITSIYDLPIEILCYIIRNLHMRFFVRQFLDLLTVNKSFYYAMLSFSKIIYYNNFHQYSNLDLKVLSEANINFTSLDLNNVNIIDKTILKYVGNIFYFSDKYPSTLQQEATKNKIKNSSKIILINNKKINRFISLKPIYLDQSSLFCIKNCIMLCFYFFKCDVLDKLLKMMTISCDGMTELAKTYIPFFIKYQSEFIKCTSNFFISPFQPLPHIIDSGNSDIVTDLILKGLIDLSIRINNMESINKTNVRYIFDTIKFLYDSFQEKYFMTNEIEKKLQVIVYNLIGRSCSVESTINIMSVLFDESYNSFIKGDICRIVLTCIKITSHNKKSCLQPINPRIVTTPINVNSDKNYALSYIQNINELFMNTDFQKEYHNIIFKNDQKPKKKFISNILDYRVQIYNYTDLLNFYIKKSAHHEFVHHLLKNHNNLLKNKSVSIEIAKSYEYNPFKLVKKLLKYDKLIATKTQLIAFFTTIRTRFDDTEVEIFKKYIKLFIDTCGVDAVNNSKIIMTFVFRHKRNYKLLDAFIQSHDGISLSIQDKNKNNVIHSICKYSPYKIEDFDPVYNKLISYSSQDIKDILTVKNNSNMTPIQTIPTCPSAKKIKVSIKGKLEYLLTSLN
jgi:hypothetical protein